MFRSALSALVIFGCAAGALVVTWPQLFGLERVMPVAQAVSLRGLGIVVAAAVMLALLLLATLSRSFRRFFAAVAVVLVVFCLAGVAVLSTRGFGTAVFQPTASTDLTVVEWNTLGGAPGPSVIARLALSNNADILSLPETTEETANAVAAQMRSAGRPMAVHTIAFNHIAKSKSTSVLISAALGGYHLDATGGSTSTVPTLVLRPDGGAGPVIVGVHVVSPQPAEFSRWKSDLAFAKATCVGSNVILAGDFNATVDHFTGLGSGGHGTIGNCSDAAVASDNAAVGTWPAVLPALLGAPIDHVLTTPNWRVSGMRVVQDLDGAGSDHRPIVVQLSHNG